MATVKYDICSKIVTPLSTSVFTRVGESDSLSVNTTLPLWAPPMATTVSPALTLTAVVVATKLAPAFVADVTKTVAKAGLTKPTRRKSEIRKLNTSRLR